MNPAELLPGFSGSITIDLTALLLPPLTFTIWRVQTRRERRDRTIRVFQMYESQTMKHDRRDAWRYLTELTGPVVPLTDLMRDSDPERLNAYGSCIGVLKFFATVDRLLETKHLDRRLVGTLLESDRSSWAAAFERAGIRPDVDPYVAEYLERLGRSFMAATRRAPRPGRDPDDGRSADPTSAGPVAREPNDVDDGGHDRP